MCNTMIFFSITGLFLGMICQSKPSIHQKDAFRSLLVNGMQFQWSIEENLLHCKATAPASGWIAVGFHVNDQLAGTNLIMGAAEDGFYKMDDRYIVKPGLHKNMLELGVQEALLNKKVIEKGNTTIMCFSIPLKANDIYHHDLIAGETYHILLAYSREDDFQHHSIMRTSVKINL